MARKTSAKGLVNGLEGEAALKKQLGVILEVLGGRKSVATACEELAVSEPTFHRMKDKALSGALEALVPKAAGRPAKPAETTPEVEALKAQILELRMDLQCSRVREEIALVMPHVLTPRSDEKKSPKASQEISVRRKGTKSE